MFATSLLAFACSQISLQRRTPSLFVSDRHCKKLHPEVLPVLFVHSITRRMKQSILDILDQIFFGDPHGGIRKTSIGLRKWNERSRADRAEPRSLFKLQHGYQRGPVQMQFQRSSSRIKPFPGALRCACLAKPRFALIRRRRVLKFG